MNFFSVHLGHLSAFMLFPKTEITKMNISPFKLSLSAYERWYPLVLSKVITLFKLAMKG